MSRNLRVYYNQASHAFLHRNYRLALALLDAGVLRQLPDPAVPWAAPSAVSSATDREKDDQRRKALLLWLTAAVCAFDARGEAAASPPPSWARGRPRTTSTAAGSGSAAAGDPPAGRSAAPVASAAFVPDAELDSLLHTGNAEDVFRFLLARCHRAYRCSPARAAAAAAAGPAASLLPPPVVHTLLLSAAKLVLPSQLVSSLVLEPFLSSLPVPLVAQLAALSRARETSEGQQARVAGNEGWLGETLDGYERIVEAWCVAVLGQGEGKIREAMDVLGQDGVLGKTKKESLLHTLTHLPPLTPSPPSSRPLLLPSSSSFTASMKLHQPTPSRASVVSPAADDDGGRPPSPALSETGSDSSDSSVMTATPRNYRDLVAPSVVGGGSSAHGKGSAKGRRKAALTEEGNSTTAMPSSEPSTSTLAQIHRFLIPRSRPSSPRPARRTSTSASSLTTTSSQSFTALIRSYLPTSLPRSQFLFLLAALLLIVGTALRRAMALRARQAGKPSKGGGGWAGFLGQALLLKAVGGGAEGGGGRSAAAGGRGGASVRTKLARGFWGRIAG